jgi:hypothetical protein
MLRRTAHIPFPQCLCRRTTSSSPQTLQGTTQTNMAIAGIGCQKHVQILLRLDTLTEGMQRLWTKKGVMHFFAVMTQKGLPPTLLVP